MITTDQSQRLDWYVRKKTDASITITCLVGSSAFDLTGYVFIAEVFSFGNPTPILTMTEGAGITNGHATGVLVLALTDTQLNITGDDYFWILRTTAPDDTFWFNGQFTVNAALWDDATDSVVNLIVELGTQNVNAQISLSGGGLSNLDGGFPSNNYGATTGINGGTP